MSNLQAQNSKKLKNNSNFWYKISGKIILWKPDPKNRRSTQSPQIKTQNNGGKIKEKNHERQKATLIH